VTKSRGIGRGGARPGSGRKPKPWGTRHRTAVASPQDQDPDVARVSRALHVMLAAGGDLAFMAELIMGRGK
jgi:hypothetical protein